MAMSGKPAIIDPRTFDLRAFQSSVQNIRERFRLLDTAVSNLQNTVGGSTLSDQVNNLQQQLLALQVRVTAVEGALGPNDTVQLQADEAMLAGMPVVPSSTGRCRLADPTDPTAVYAPIGLAVNAVETGHTVTVLRRGAMSVTGAVFDPGFAVYAGADGELLQFPTYGYVSLPLGVAIGASTVWVAPGDPALLALGFDGLHEQFLPATVQLMSNQDDLLQIQIDDLAALVAQLMYDVAALTGTSPRMIAVFSTLRV